MYLMRTDLSLSDRIKVVDMLGEKMLQISYQVLALLWTHAVIMMN